MMTSGDFGFRFGAVSADAGKSRHRGRNVPFSYRARAVLRFKSSESTLAHAMSPRALGRPPPFWRCAVRIGGDTLKRP